MSVTEPQTTSSEAARRHLLSPAEDMAKLGSAARPLLRHAEGIHLFDADGRALIDGPGGMWCSQIGYGRQEMADAIASQVMALPYNSPWHSINGPAAELARRIATLTPGDLDHIFFTTGGSTAVDSALRFVQYFNNVLERPAKKKILVRYRSYHGSTELAASCSPRPQASPFDTADPKIVVLSSPDARDRPAGMSEEEHGLALAAEFERVIAREGAETLGAFIAEPVQASGGVIVPPANYFALMRAICAQHDILFIADEVVTGFGRLGHWFASEAVMGIVPDLIVFAKGVTSGYVPMGGFAISDRILARVSGEHAKGRYFSNGYTYSGHPVAAAAALANIAIFEREEILAHVRAVAPHFQAGLRALRRYRLVTDVRGAGLVGCVECAGDDDAMKQAIGARVDRHCQELGLVVRPIVNNCVLSPPLIIKRAEIDQMMDILAKAIELTEADLMAEDLWPKSI
ncbi:Adenosylmethionine-8-amino-7-oxononanoate aminotransferase [Arboricoccus pini]|uniref:Adenosylmethionine-8-amino-7-oxononanoate aminotransferase n=1 Tax=Arboricoccus pini TaxID=1963835 RepID=A0A212R3K8_9PROT|nr:aminotransferase [Arboricoccus pini]SNB66580.1 Adenosylmethionine-8-amino-7-oxononanoate aminotransferase [Arboricoccus pini]